MKMSHVI